MTRRAATARQVEIRRTIRAMKQEGLKIVRIVARPDGIAVETDAAPEPVQASPVDPRKKPIVL